MDKSHTLQRHLEYKNLTVSSKASLDIIERIVGGFIKSSRKPLDEFTEEEVVKYFKKLKEKYSTSSHNNFRVMVKVFIEWYYDDYPKRFKNLKKLCKKEMAESPYTPDEMLKKKDVEKLVQYEHEPRWKAFWLIYFYGGFRPKEVCELKWEDITFSGDEAYVTLNATKTGKNFEKYLPSNVVFYLRKIQNNDSVYVFPTKRRHKNTTKKGKDKIGVGDKPQTRSGVYQHLRDIAPKVFGKHINPYILRHSIATILYNEESNKDDDVAQQMGHSVSMRKVYSKPKKEQIREKMKKLYIKAEELPPEKKQELEEQIVNIRKEYLESMKKYADEVEAIKKTMAQIKKNKKGRRKN